MNATVSEVKRTDLPGVSERRQVHILNPKSGSQKHSAAVRHAVENVGGQILASEKQGQITSLVAELFEKDPYAHAVVYGGDGTVYETVNGIMQSGHNDTASFSVVPAGSGNDFSAYMNDAASFRKAELIPLDLTRTECGGSVRYGANVTNMGFDCDVVMETYALKKLPMFRGPLGYIAGVGKVFMKKKTIPARIEITGCARADGSVDENARIYLEQEVLLTACANAQFYGGGFRVAPIASVTDGLMDVLVVDDITRAQFLSLVKYYHDGTFINEQGQLLERFKKILRYEKCRKLRMEGPRWFCVDGEVFPTGGAPVTVENVKGAVWFAAL